MPKYKFQIKLSGEWKDYFDEENGILTRAYMSGSKKANYVLRGNSYEYDFVQMKQINKLTGKERKIRPPPHLKPPAAPIVKPGPTMMAIVPPGAQPGSKILVPHPHAAGVSLQVVVPPHAKPGNTLLVPVPPVAPGARGAAWPPPQPPHSGQVVVPQQQQQPTRQQHSGQVVVPTQQGGSPGYGAMPPPQPMYQQPAPSAPPPGASQQQQPPAQQEDPKKKQSGGGYGAAWAVGVGVVGWGAVGAGVYYAHQQGAFDGAGGQAQGWWQNMQQQVGPAMQTWQYNAGQLWGQWGGVAQQGYAQWLDQANNLAQNPQVQDFGQNVNSWAGDWAYQLQNRWGNAAVGLQPYANDWGNWVANANAQFAGAVDPHIQNLANQQIVQDAWQGTYQMTQDVGNAADPVISDWGLMVGDIWDELGDLAGGAGGFFMDMLS